MVTIPLQPFTLPISGVDTLKIEALGSPFRQMQPDGSFVAMQKVYFELSCSEDGFLAQRGNRELPAAIANPLLIKYEERTLTEQDLETVRQLLAQENPDMIPVMPQWEPDYNWQEPIPPSGETQSTSTTNP